MSKAVNSYTINCVVISSTHSHTTETPTGQNRPWSIQGLPFADSFIHYGVLPHCLSQCGCCAALASGCLVARMLPLRLQDLPREAAPCHHRVIHVAKMSPVHGCHRSFLGYPALSPSWGSSFPLCEWQSSACGEKGDAQIRSGSLWECSGWSPWCSQSPRHLRPWKRSRKETVWLPLSLSLYFLNPTRPKQVKD